MSTVKVTNVAIIRAGIRLGFVLAVAGLVAGWVFSRFMAVILRWATKTFATGSARS